jgi:putative oxidoreductase
MKPILSRVEGPVYAVLRIVAGSMFAAHGAQKLFGVLGGRQQALFTQLWLAGVIELVGGVLVAVGFLASPVAFVCSGLMAVAYWQSHAPRGVWPVQNGGELAALYCFVFLYIAARGAGRWSVDRK